MEAAIVEVATILELQRATAREYLEAVGGSLQDACFLHYCVTGEIPPQFAARVGKPLAPSPGFKITVNGSQPSSALSAKDITQWEELAFQSLPHGSDPELCSICLYAFQSSDSGQIVRLGRCRAHFFHKACIALAVSHGLGLRCPVCGTAYGVQIGPMPAGTLGVQFNSAVRCEGSQAGAWVLTYNFPNGTLPSGQAYSGTSRQAFIPAEGPEVVRLLIYAFYRRQTFTVGTSFTTVAQNTVVWNGIHHKTSTGGGPTNFGYPDCRYFSRVKLELASHGISY